MNHVIDALDGAAFVAQLVGTGQFTRNAKSQVLFELEPGDFIAVSNKSLLLSLLKDASAVRLSADYLDFDTHGSLLWSWLTEYKWKLPRTGGTPTPKVVRS